MLPRRSSNRSPHHMPVPRKKKHIVADIPLANEPMVKKVKGKEGMKMLKVEQKNGFRFTTNSLQR